MSSILTGAWHRHEGHDVQITKYSCGCERASCTTCDITDGMVGSGGPPGRGCTFDFSKGRHPALTAPTAYKPMNWG